MKSRNLVLGGLAVLVVAALVIANRPAERPTTVTSQPSPSSSAPATPAAQTPAASEPASGERVPHFHARLEDALPLPRILPASNFRIPVVARAYQIAARIPEVLAQQPCYCWCDKMGHGSLVDCFATDHGAG